MQGANVTASPDVPELPELPELPDVAWPLAVADPVLPELALPDPAWVSLELVEEADPVFPPVVVPLAVESPLAPEVAVASDPVETGPVGPDAARPVAAEPWSLEPHDPPGEPGPDWTALRGEAVPAPESPESFWVSLPATAGPVEPDGPAAVVPDVLELPELASELELDEVSTGPELPPWPEPPETATGWEEAFPVSVEPVEPVEPVEDQAFPHQPE
jgi:hypothetical protein